MGRFFLTSGDQLDWLSTCQTAQKVNGWGRESEGHEEAKGRREGTFDQTVPKFETLIFYMMRFRSKFWKEWRIRQFGLIKSIVSSSPKL